MFDPDSELSRLCRDIRPGEAVPVSETLYTFLEQNLEICRLSGGAFDPTVGPVVKLWDFLSQTPQIPLRSASGRCWTGWAISTSAWTGIRGP